MIKISKEETKQNNEKASVEIKFCSNSKIKNKAMKKMIKKQNIKLIFLSIPMFISVVIEILMLYFLRDLSKFALVGDVNKTIHMIQIVLIAMGFLIPCLILNQILKVKFIENSAVDMKSYYIDFLIGMEIRKFQKNTAEKYISLGTNSINIIISDYFSSKYEILNGILMIIGGVVLSILVDWRIIVFAGGIAIVIYIIVTILGASIGKIIEDYFGELEKYTGKLREILSGMHLIKVNSLESKFTQIFRNRSAKLQDSKISFMKAENRIGVFAQIVTALFLGGFILFVVLQSLKGAYDKSEIIFLLSSFAVLLLPAVLLLQKIPTLKMGKDAFLEISKLDELKDKNDEVDQIEDKKIKDNIQFKNCMDKSIKLFPGFSHSILFSNISFGYTLQKQLFSEVNLTLEIGKKYLIVGKSGSGKSTFLKLFQNYISPNKGTVLIDKIPIHYFEHSSLLEKIAYVNQHVFLFEDTVKNNITMYVKYPDEKIAKAIEDAELESLILNHGNLEGVLYDDGKNVSGGEKMRIALVRALITEAEIFLLDEPFAGLNDALAIDIERRFLSIPDVTLINVSHVVFKENLELYDKVISIENGKISVINSVEFNSKEQ